MKLTLILAAAAALMLAVPQPSQAQNFFQGFETDTSGWFDNGGTVNREPSGYSSSYANEINSAAGDYHARLGLDPSSECVPGSASCSGPTPIGEPQGPECR
jgi:hypothetical protein